MNNDNMDNSTNSNNKYLSAEFPEAPDPSGDYYRRRPAVLKSMCLAVVYRRMYIIVHRCAYVYSSNELNHH